MIRRRLRDALHRTALIGAAIFAVGALTISAACGSPLHNAPSATGAKTIAISESSNSTTVSVPVGDYLVVHLHSTYWTIAVPTSPALTKVSSSTIAGGPGCSKIPGMGCGVVSMTFHALRVATVQLSAHRTSCGEALRCTGTNGHWTAKIRLVKR